MPSTGLIGKDSFTTSAGVKQGGSSSCKFFTAYIDPTIDAVNTHGPDDWLKNIHLLLLMDDTVVFATSRERLDTKLKLLKNCADDLDMIIHPTKSQYITVNSKDEAPFILQDAIISKTNN